MTLLQKQWVFSSLLSRFVSDLIKRGYKITYGETFRPLATAQLNAAKGIGIANSLHTLRLAADLNIFKDSKFLMEKAEYQEAGELWEAYTTDEIECCWGGRFASPDSDHFSVSHNGIK